MSASSSKRYPPELRERAVRMVAAVSDQHASESAAMGKVTRLLGIGTAKRCASGYAKPRSMSAPAHDQADPGAVSAHARRAMMEALIGGQRDPRTLAGLAKGLTRKKTDRLEEALRGFFTDHHATILRMMLDNTDRISAQITALDTRIQEAIGPFSQQAAQLADIPGVDTVAAAELIAEIGVDMTRFPSAAHLVSWAKFCPQTHQSAGKSRTKGHGKGNPWLAGTLGRIAFINSRTNTFLGARYRRLARRRGKHKAIVATGNSVLTVIYHLLSDPDARFCDGPGYYESRINKHRRAAIWPPNSEHSPANTSPSATAKPSSPTPPLNPKPTAAPHHPATPGAFGLPPHRSIFGSDEGKLYLAIVLDLFSRKLLASPTAEHPDAELAGDAIKMAAAERGGRTVIDGVIFHTDYADVCVKPRICGDRLCRWGLLVDSSA
jgi:transposase InsO family protein